MVASSKNRRALFYSVLLTAAIMSAWYPLTTLFRRGLSLDHIGGSLSYLLTGALPGTLLWALIAITLGRRVRYGKWYVAIVALTAPISFKHLAPALMEYLAYPLFFLFEWRPFHVRFLWDDVSSGRIFGQYIARPVSSTLLIALAGSSLMLCRRLWSCAPREQYRGSQIQWSENDDARQGEAPPGWLVRSPDVSVLGATLITCFFNPVVWIALIYLGIAASRDQYGYGEIGFSIAIANFFPHCLVYMLAYQWIGATVRNTGILLLKGLVTLVVLYPLSLALASAAVSVVGFGELDASGVGFFMFFSGIFGTVPVLVAAIVSLLMTRVFLFRSVGKAAPISGPQPSKPSQSPAASSG